MRIWIISFVSWALILILQMIISNDFKVLPLKHSPNNLISSCFQQLLIVQMIKLELLSLAFSVFDYV